MTETAAHPNLNDIAAELANLTNEEIKNRIRIFDNNIKQYKLEMNKINSDMKKVIISPLFRSNNSFKTTAIKLNKINNFLGLSAMSLKS